MDTEQAGKGHRVFNGGRKIAFTCRARIGAFGKRRFGRRIGGHLGSGEGGILPPGMATPNAEVTV